MARSPDFTGNPAQQSGGQAEAVGKSNSSATVSARGNTDFATPLRPDRPWKTRDGLIDTVIVAITASVKTLYAGNPATPFVIIWPDRGIPSADEKARLDRDGKSQPRQTAQRLGLKPPQVIAIASSDLNAQACGFYGSASNHRTKAQGLIDHIPLQPDLWARR